MARIVKRLTAKQRSAFIAAARSFAGVPFRHRGRSERGVDCLGLVVCAMQAAGREMADRPAYGRDPTGDLGAMQLAARAHFGEPIYRAGGDLSVLRPGDVVLMRWHQQPNHVAIVTDYPSDGLALIHSLVSLGRVVEHRLADPWPRRILEAYRP